MPLILLGSRKCLFQLNGANVEALSDYRFFSLTTLTSSLKVNFFEVLGKYCKKMNTIYASVVT